MEKRKLTRKEKQEAHRKELKEKPVRERPGLRDRAGLLLALLAILLYANTLRNDFVLDDFSAIKKNWVVKQGVSSFGTILTTSYRFGYRDSDDELYRPLPLMVFATLWQAFPENPMPFHLLNVVLYALTGIVLYRLLKKIFGGYNPLLAFFASALFVVHPLHTEVVANIKSLDEILSFLFTLLTVEQLMKYAGSGALKHLLVSWTYFFLAFLSKEGTIVMLAVIPLILLMFTNATKGMVVRVSVVLASAAVVFIAMRINALGGFNVGKKFLYIENVLVKAPDYAIRLATIFTVLALYVRLMVFPHPLSSDYSFKEIDLSSWSEPLPWISLFVYAGMIILAIRTFRKNKVVSFAILFFLATISLYSNILMTIGSLFAERFLYAPLLGFTIVAGWVVMRILKLPLESAGGEGVFSTGANKPALAVLVVLVVPCSLATVARNADWQNTVALFSKDILHSPNSALLNYNYANELKIEKAVKMTDPVEKNRYLDSAIVHYKKAIELYPPYVEAHEQLGLAYYYYGMDSFAFAELNKALELDPRKSTAYNSLGTLYFEKANNHVKALELFQKSVELNPNYIDGWRNVGCAYGTMAQYEKAIEAFRRVLRLDPANVDVLQFMAQTYRTLGDEATASTYTRQAEAAKKIQETN